MPALRTTCLVDFYPRPPRGGRRRGIFCLSDGAVISIHALREEGDVIIELPTTQDAISIHALREEGDVVDGDRPRDVSISIHALREEGDSKNRDKISIFL